MASVEVVPSPKVQAWDASVPSGSELVELSNAHDHTVHELVKAAVGFWFGGGTVTEIGWVTVLLAPLLSVTIRATV